MTTSSHVTFGIVDPELGREAYQWHRGFAGANRNVYGRPWSDYEKLAERGQVMSAVDDNKDYLGLVYFHFEKKRKAWELGGMMVSELHRGRGIGSILGRVTLAHVLFEEDPLSRGEKILARVIERNRDPRPLLETQSAFRKEEGAMQVPADELAGVTPNEHGIIVGDHYEMDPVTTCAGLADWCQTWDQKLKDGTPAIVRMRPGVTLALWERAFRDMAANAF